MKLELRSGYLLIGSGRPEHDGSNLYIATIQQVAEPSTYAVGDEVLFDVRGTGQFVQAANATLLPVCEVIALVRPDGAPSVTVEEMWRKLPTPSLSA